MKLKNSFVSHNTNNEQVLVAADGSFNGIIKSNSTAGFIIDCLKQDTDENKIVDLMAEKYNAPKDIIARDVHGVIEKLKTIGAIEE